MNLDLSKSADKIAPLLLGQYLCRRFANGKVGRYKITEVEAYLGEKDKACHSSRGRTKRTEVMYGPPGYWYVYLIYGMYHMLNLVTGPKGTPEAILIREVEGINGPGRLTRALKVNKDFNGKEAIKINNLWIEFRRINSKSVKVAKLPRVGVDYAGEWKDKLLRFRVINK